MPYVHLSKTYLFVIIRPDQVGRFINRHISHYDITGFDTLKFDSVKNLHRRFFSTPAGALCHKFAWIYLRFLTFVVVALFTLLCDQCK